MRKGYSSATVRTLPRTIGTKEKKDGVFQRKKKTSIHLHQRLARQFLQYSSQFSPMTISKKTSTTRLPQSLQQQLDEAASTSTSGVFSMYPFSFEFLKTIQSMIRATMHGIRTIVNHILLLRLGKILGNKNVLLGSRTKRPIFLALIPRILGNAERKKNLLNHPNAKS